jgi:hypothetical protein
MNRRQFVTAWMCAPLFRSHLLAEPESVPAWLGRPAAGQVVNLAMCGALKSWLNPGPHELLSNPRDFINISSLSGGTSPVDVGVEWPEFRTIHQVVIRFAGSLPQPGSIFLEYWDGLTALQGAWKPVGEGLPNGSVLSRTAQEWTYNFQQRRTCKVRLRFTEARSDIQLHQLAVYGPSIWKSGEVRLEWGHSAVAPWHGQLECYNSKVTSIQPNGAARLQGASGWVSDERQKSGLIVSLLYTWGMDVDRSILTVRSKTATCSFLPGEALESDPIDIVDCGLYIRSGNSATDVTEYRHLNSNRSRTIDLVSREPEQTIDNAYAHIKARRVTLSFVGAEANSHKFGIAPDGHVVVGSGDPLAGNPITPTFAVYFDTAETPSLFQPPSEPQHLFVSSKELSDWVLPKQQRLKDGSLPVITTEWSENDLAFERTDFGTLVNAAQPLEQQIGNEPAALLSKLTLRNSSPDTKLASYYIRPWKPEELARFPYGPIPTDTKDTWTTGLTNDIITSSDGNYTYVTCFVNRNRKGELSLDPSNNAVRYRVHLKPGETHVVNTVIPGWLPKLSEATTLQTLDFETLERAATRHWDDRTAQLMRIQIPDRHLQNVFDATLQHFLLVLTRNGNKRELYPNVAMLHYGSIGSESSPIIRALDMRGLHDVAEQCLDAFLSTQGDSMPDGDYQSKTGGFYRFWPIYTVNQGGVLWALADHYNFTRDDAWLKRVAPKIIAGCDFIVRERRRTMTSDSRGVKPLHYGLAPAGCVADPRDWQYSFMLNAWFYAGLKKSLEVLSHIYQTKALALDAEARDYKECIIRALNESVALSPVTRLRDGTSVSSVPPYLGLRGFSTDAKDSVDPDRRHGYAYDCTIGPFHLFNCGVLDPNDPLVTAMLNYLEDRFFLFTPLPSRVDLDQLGTDWFDMGGFEKLQPYYVHYQEAYLRRDQIPNFIRGFYNTLASISDPDTLTFQEELDFGGGQPHKTHEEACFFHQMRHMLVMEEGEKLYLARGTPRGWLKDGEQIVIQNAPTYFGRASYRIRSSVNSGTITAELDLPNERAFQGVLRLRHPSNKPLREVRLNDQQWTKFDPTKEQIELPSGMSRITLTAGY